MQLSNRKVANPVFEAMTVAALTKPAMQPAEQIYILKETIWIPAVQPVLENWKSV